MRSASGSLQPAVAKIVAMSFFRRSWRRFISWRSPSLSGLFQIFAIAVVDQFPDIVFAQAGKSLPQDSSLLFHDLFEQRGPFIKERQSICEGQQFSARRRRL